MPITAAIVRELMAAGLTADALVAALERIESADFCGAPADTRSVDVSAERRRERDRLRKSAERLRKSADRAGIDNTTTTLEVSKKDSPLPLKAEVCGQPPDLFETSFWPVYPKKVGKGDARRAFKTASKKTSIETIVVAAKRFAASCVGKDDTFIPHPASWLNGERWQDANLADPEPSEAATKTVPVIVDTPQWEAWSKVRKRIPITDLKMPNGQIKRGWYMPSEFPPQEQAH